MRIGVFDSGIGGEAVASSLRSAFASAEVIRVSDRAHIPYGNRSPADILRLTAAAIEPLLSAQCDVIVIACNTASATALPQLRLDNPDQRFVGLEPMIKPAARLSKTKRVAVFATPVTLKSASYKRLKLLYGARLSFIEPDCSAWADMIERNIITQSDIDNVVRLCIKDGADVIVLGCTHYHWIKDEIVRMAGGRASVIEPTGAIINQIKSLLAL